MCQDLAGIPEDGIAIGALVDWEIAFKHTAARPKGFDTGVNVRLPGGGQRRR